MRFEFAGETLSCLHMFWNAGLLAASETGGVIRNQESDVRNQRTGDFEA